MFDKCSSRVCPRVLYGMSVTHVRNVHHYVPISCHNGCPICRIRIRTGMQPAGRRNWIQFHYNLYGDLHMVQTYDCYYFCTGTSTALYMRFAIHYRATHAA